MQAAPLPPVNAFLLMGTQNVKYSRRVLEYSLRYSPSTRVANYSDSTALVALPSELLYTDDLVVTAETVDDLMSGRIT